MKMNVMTKILSAMAVLADKLLFFRASFPSKHNRLTRDLTHYKIVGYGLFRTLEIVGYWSRG